MYSANDGQNVGCSIEYFKNMTKTVKLFYVHNNSKDPEKYINFLFLKSGYKTKAFWKQSM